MGLRFWKSEPGPAAIDSKLRELITNRFKLSTGEIDKLSVLRRAGKFAGRPVTRLRVYDPSLIDGDAAQVSKFLDLDAQSQAVCFEGHDEKGRAMDLNARGCMEEAAPAA